MERGWKLARDKGLGAVSGEDLRRVRVTGQLRLCTEDRWRAAAACTLQVRPEDAALATTLLRKQRALLSDLGINVWIVDRRTSGSSTTYDLLADFGTSRNFGVQGRLWVELKVFSQASFDKEVGDFKEELAQGLPTQRRRDSSLEGVLLLAAKVEQRGGGWGAPALLATLLTRSSSEWQTLAGGSRRAGRGRCQSAKPSLATVFNKMEWPETAQGRTVGLLRHFLEEFSLPVNNAGQRADTYNALLREARYSGKFYETKLRNKAGRKPWVASKETFRAVYKFL